MAKPKSGYKRQFGYQPPPGARVEISTKEAAELLLTCAKACRCTIGQYAEERLAYALSGEPYLALPRPFPTTTKLPKPRVIYIDQALFDRITLKVGAGKEMRWIAGALLFLAQIDGVWIRGSVREPDRSAIK